MGRKSKSSRIQQSVKLTNRHNNNQSQNELNNLIDQLLRLSTIPQETNIVKSLENQRRLQELLERIDKIENPTDNRSNVNGNNNNDDDRYSGAIIDEFVKWTRENGAKFDGCSIIEFDGYDLGLRADLNIPESSLIIAVPKTIMMTIENAKQSDLNVLLEKDRILQMMPNVALSIFLLYEKFKENSFWKPYIDILPKTYTTVLYFTVDELEELKGSPTLEIALRQIKSIARQYAYFHKLFNSSDQPVCKLLKSRFTFNEYRWAVSTVMTRQNTIPFQDNYYALIPLWDLCNHSNGTITTAYNPELDRSECLAFRDFKKGEQIFIFYGGRSNADFFIHNGFVYEDNEHDNYWIRLGISKSDPLHQKRSELLSKISIPTVHDFCIRRGQKPVDGQLLAFLRIFNMNEEQIQHWLRSDKSGDLVYQECALDTTLEKKAWIFLQTRLKLILASYRTTLEDDLGLIEQTKQQPNRCLAVRMRATEKRIIQHTLECVEQYIAQ